MRSRPPLAVLVAVLCLAVTLRPAEAKGDPISPADYPELTERILNPKDPTAREGALDSLLRSTRAAHPEAYGAVLGPIFRDPARTSAMTPEDRRALFATLIDHLADDQPDGGAVLLVRDFLPLLAADPQLVRVLREELLGRNLRNEQEGWVRILDRAGGLLGDEDPVVRRAALQITAHCDCVHEAETLAVLYEAMQKAESPTAEDQAAYLAAAERLLEYRFATLSDLRNFLGERAALFATAEVRKKEWTDADRYRVRAAILDDVIDLYRERGGEGIQRARKAALAYGKTVIEKAEGPADLVVFFDPDRERFEELQLAAMAAAAPPRMKPAPDAAWADLLVRVLKHSDDAAVLARVIAIIGETFTEPTEHTGALAAAIAGRLQRGVATDALAQRVSLASILGSIGLRNDVRAALPPRLSEADTAQKDVLSKLIRALGIVKDGLVVQLPPYYRAGDRLQPEWARVAVAEALGLHGFSTNAEQGPAAAMMLHHILTGEAVRAVKVVPDAAQPDAFRVDVLTGDAATQAAEAGDDDGEVLLWQRALRDGVERETSPAVLAAAVKSLEFYPGPDAAAVLGSIAISDGAAADDALRSLGRQLGRGSIPAAKAIARLLERDPPLAEPRLLAALDAILSAPWPKKAEARVVLGRAVRGLLAGGHGEPVRARAAAAAAHLADVKAVMPVYLAWNAFEPQEPGRKTWRELLERLVVAVAKAGRELKGLDGQLAEELRGIASEASTGTVLELFAAMGQDANRYELKRLRADLHFEFAEFPDNRSRDDRRKDLTTALRLFKELAPQAPSPSLRSDHFRSIYFILVKRAEPAWLAPNERPEPLLLEALDAAEKSGNQGLAQEALDKLGEPLRQSGALSEAQKTLLEQRLERLKLVAEGKPAKTDKK